MTDTISAPSGVLAARYEIEALVGRGAMGEVFRARDLTLGDTVAVKVLRLDARDAVATLALFKQEVRLARRVTHRNVARVFDLVETGDTLLLTMELVLGETLRDRLMRDGPLPIDRAIAMATEICAGLEAVHAAGIVHRDLKPSNILLEAEGRVVLVDFGVARSTLDGASLRLGVIVGTPRYMAPEQAKGLAVDRRADLYSLGVVLDEMAGGEAADARYREVVRRCLEPDRDNRPASAAEVASALGAIAQSSRPPASRTSQRSLVVLPFRVMSTSEAASLGGVVAEELTDVLCTIRELRVIASGAAARFAETRDPERIHAALGASAFVDGTVEIDQERVRITVRFIEAPSGNQLWRERYEGDLSQLFSFESSIARRVAEHVRARAVVMVFDEGVPPEAVRSFLSASALRMNPLAAGEMLKLLDRAIAIHPTFAPALSSLALRSLTAWYVPFVHTPADWGETCARRVARALEGAPSLTETHVASAILHLERGEIRDAELALRHALELAPTSVEALVALGELEHQTGRSAAGTTRARLAHALDPGAIMPVVTLAREEAYAGRLDACVALLDAMGDAAWNPPAFLLRIRAAGWHRSHETIRSWLQRGTGMSDASGRFPYGEVVGRALLGESPRDERESMVAGLLSVGKSPRFRVESLRIATEMSIVNGQKDDALGHLRALAETPAFYDVAWLERCPALRPLAADRAFLSVVETARRRAYAT